MSLSIILDKSTFQSLNFNELYRLSCYYQHIVTPVLTMEILGDLRKKISQNKNLQKQENRVKDFAKKLFPTETVVNMHYKYLVKGDLLGDLITMDGRPTVSIKKSVSSYSGQKGFLIEESEEEKSIYKWKDGRFSEADKELSLLWRMTTTDKSVLERLKKSLKSSVTVRFNNYSDLNEFVDSSLSTPESQLNLLLAMMQNYEIDAYTGLQIVRRWRQTGNPLIKDFSPYAFHCLKVDTLFLFGLSSGLISTRPTNRVDLEYLYYLPFAYLFSSSDKIHKNLVPLVLMPFQKFIHGNDLKMDLKNIVEHIEKLKIEEKRLYKGKPPIEKNSLTFQLWKEYFGYPDKSTFNREISEDEMEKAKAKMKEFEQALQNDEINLKSSDDADFIIKESYLSKNDLCYCGSGKKVIECCLLEEEFDRIAHEDMIKKQKKNNK